MESQSSNAKIMSTLPSTYQNIKYLFLFLSLFQEAIKKFGTLNHILAGTIADAQRLAAQLRILEDKLFIFPKMRTVRYTKSFPSP